ncbi:MAG: DUF2442 domain-containing protein [Bacteroidetes bacterium]|nr:DUF2442 domain-containing protein [Bacteroidota bacterium]MBI3482727.1 DUF2442 domain-containing protein [Bacteroidota bacterium]
MKITIEKSRQQKIVKVVDVKYLNDFVMRVLFDDMSEQVVDFKPFLSKASHPDIKKYFKESNFKKFKIIDGNINWNDYELIFPIEHLYKGQIK